MVTLRCNQKFKHVSATLPASKSISNRQLIIRELTKGAHPYQFLSEAEDTVILQKCLKDFRHSTRLDAGQAGTAYRFLTAFLATQDGEWDLGCSERMKERPLFPLVDALRLLGAGIDYLQREGFPPVHIKGRKLEGGRVVVDAGISSQFISALLLIAPTLRDGLDLELTGQIASQPYIEMTVQLMKGTGAQVEWKDHTIKVAPSEYIGGPYIGEADWSAAAFFYEMACISDALEMNLPSLKRPSLQGDSRCAELWEPLGLKTRDTLMGVSLERKEKITPEITADFLDVPDLFIPFACSCAARQVKLIATGLRNLSIKESDRLTATGTELTRLGYACEVLNENTFILYPESRMAPSVTPVIKTYGDHRIAMAFAVLAAQLGEIRLDDLSCTAKSYPGFLKTLQQMGFTIEEGESS